MGDTVLLTSMIEILHRRFPSAQIDVVVSTPWNSLLEEDPRVHKVWPYTRFKQVPSRAKAIAQLGFKLRKEKYSWVLNFHASPSSATLALATGCKMRSIHFHGHKDKNKYSTVTIEGKGIVKPAIERDADTLRALGLEFTPPEIKIQISDQTKSLVEKKFESLDIKEKWIGLGIGASRPTKQWPLQYYKEVTTEWLKNSTHGVFLFTGPGEEILSKNFLKDFDKSSQIQHFHNQNLREISYLLSKTALYIGNDSGLKHLAIASGTRTLTLMGPEDPYEWHPYSKENHPYLYIENLNCRKDHLEGMPPWCALHDCKFEKHRCMTEITPGQVIEKMKGLIL
tara:strand:- start:1005 stop:2021 length:1017 start_codon:yes stop_codon:yes gene_type:complete